MMRSRQSEALGLLVILIGGTVAMIWVGWNNGGPFAAFLLTLCWWAMFLLQAGPVEARWKADEAERKADIERRLKLMSDIDRNRELAEFLGGKGTR